MVEMNNKPIVKPLLIAFETLTRKALVELQNIPVLNSFYR